MLYIDSFWYNNIPYLVYLCRQRKLSVPGRKSQLIERLEAEVEDHEEFAVPVATECGEHTYASDEEVDGLISCDNGENGGPNVEEDCDDDEVEEEAPGNTEELFEIEPFVKYI
eukprot:gb/GECG01004007.1/.p1 GENE.gb/GECG01004007.1/~~gb/GECG01004007.1/.p1  ORF type:complete len:113 (+),score=24.68 gb/GECG01004007.1/:1-339(+)